MMKQLTCSTCKWFDKMPDRAGRVETKAIGTCIVNPPSPVADRKIAQYPVIFAEFKACGLYDEREGVDDNNSQAQ